MKYDKIFKNGRIYTMESEGDCWYGLAVDGEKIAALYAGESDITDEAEEVIDLQGQTMLPGFIDCHMHLLSYTQSLQSVSLRGVE